jgi:nucleoside-diphosphate-sugar epimerase
LNVSAKEKLEVAVLGGTGLIGWHTAKALKSAGHSIRVLARKPPIADLNLQDAAFQSLDLLAASEADLQAALEGCDAIVQAAGSDPRVLPKGCARDYFFAVNVEANDRLFAAAKRAGVHTVVLLTSYFHPLRPEMSDQPYVASRIASEEAAKALDAEGFRVVILQPPYVFGAVPGRKTLGDSMVKAARFPLLLPSGGTNAMSASSLAEAIVGALERKVRGSFLVGDENLSWKDLFKRFGGRSARLPTFILRGFMWLGRGILKLRRRQSGLDPVSLTNVIVSDMFFDPTESAQALGYTRGNLDEAIADLKG